MSGDIAGLCNIMLHIEKKINGNNNKKMVRRLAVKHKNLAKRTLKQKKKKENYNAVRTVTIFSENRLKR